MSARQKKKQRRNRMPDRAGSFQPKEQLVATSVEAYASFQGPLPPPQLLEGYNSVIDNGANRIMAMAEKQQEHRQSLEKAAIEGNVKAQTRGQVFAFIVALAAIGGGTYLIATGKSAAGLSTIIATVGGLVGVFIYGRRAATKERQVKRQEVAQMTGSPNKHERRVRMNTRPE